MGERGGLPIKEIPALVLDVARAQGWLDPREAESLRSALSAARADLGRETRERRAEFERLASALSAAREEADAHRADLAAAAGELLVAIPSPGSDAARLLRANVLIRQERDAAREEARARSEEALDVTLRLKNAEARLVEAREEARRLTEERDAARKLVSDFQAKVAAAEHDGGAECPYCHGVGACPRCWGRAGIERAESSARRLREALEALVLRLDAVHTHPSYQGVWSIAQMHWGPYSGPTYVDALAAARAALGSSPVAPSSREGGDEG